MCMEDIKAWFHAYFHPVDAIKKKKLVWGEGFKHVIESNFASAIVLGFFVAILAGLGMSVAMNLPLPMIKAIAPTGWLMGIAVWMLMLIIVPVYMTIIWLLDTIPLYASARLFGGNADFEEHANALAWVFAPAMFLSSLVMWIPVAGPILVGLIGLYTLYPLTMVLREVHKCETWKAVCAWLFWLVVVGILVFAGIAPLLSLLTSL